MVKNFKEKNLKKKVNCVLINMLGSESMTAAFIHALVKHYNQSITTIHFREYTPRSIEPSEEELTTLQKLILELNPDIIMLSVQALNYWDAVRITKKIKEKIDTPIIWGGAHPTGSPEDCIKHADIICVGEGDLAIKELLDRIKKHESYDNVPNLWIRKNQEIIRNPLGPLVQDLDTLPFADFSDKDKIFLYNNKIIYNNPAPVSKYVYAIMTSRGCAFHCSYCLQAINFNMYGPKFLRRRSVKNVIKELSIIKKQNPNLKSIYFWDNVLVLNDKWLEELAKEYYKKINVPFFCYAHPATVKEHTLKWLKYMGVNSIFIGIESGSPRIRRDIYKRYETQETILNATKLINKHKIKIGYDVITSNYDKIQDFHESFELFYKMSKPFRINQNNLTFYPDFPITKDALAAKIISKKDVAGYTKDIRTQYQTEKTVLNNTMVAYYSLFGRRLVPNSLIRYMVKHNWNKKYKKTFVKIPFILEKYDEGVHSIWIVFQLVISGEFKFIFSEIKKRMTNINK